MKKTDAKKEIQMKVYLSFTFVCLFGIAIIIKAAMIQITEGSKLKKLSMESQTKTDTLFAERGNIMTEDGLLLSTSDPEYDIHIDFGTIDSSVFNKNIDSLCFYMSGMFGDRTPSEYKKEFVKAYNDSDRYYTIGKNMNFDRYDSLRKFPIFRKGRGRGGFIVTKKEKRRMPYGMLGFCTIGSYRDSNKTGLERQYNKYLTGENGWVMSVREPGNVWVPVEGSEQEAQNGKDVVTTLDIGIQDVAEHALLSVLKKFECAYGTCIVMEVETGKIRALANLNLQKDGDYWEDFNYALMPTEPGSTFKLATLLSLLIDKKITAETIVDAENGRKVFANRRMSDSHTGTGAVPVWKAFAKSSNVAFAKMAFDNYENNPTPFLEHLNSFFLNKPTDIDLPREAKPFIKTNSNKALWSATSVPWMATGYELRISPMHTCMLYNAVANNGKMMKPYMVSAIREYGKDIISIPPTVLSPNIADANVIAQAKRCLNAVVEDAQGTAHAIRSPYYTIAGKTGTAQVADKGITYKSGVYQGSFVGYIPADKPKYTVCVVVRTQPNSKDYYGGIIAAPVFRMVADKIFSKNMGSWDAPLDSFAQKGSHYSIPAKNATAQDYSVLLRTLKRKALGMPEKGDELMAMHADSTRNIVLERLKTTKDIMPDVTGMGLKDAVFFLENNGMQVQVRGKGKVVAQSVPAGTAIIKGQSIVLDLS
jgi:cell division protein FtsI (penicillin-binding protein 3)